MRPFWSPRWSRSRILRICRPEPEAHASHLNTQLSLRMVGKHISHFVSPSLFLHYQPEHLVNILNLWNVSVDQICKFYRGQSKIPSRNNLFFHYICNVYIIQGFVTHYLQEGGICAAHIFRIFCEFSEKTHQNNRLRMNIFWTSKSFWTPQKTKNPKKN